MKKPRRVRPSGASAIEATGLALRAFSQTWNPTLLRGLAFGMGSLGDCLVAIARGEDARAVFGQHTDHRQSDRIYNFMRSTIYWAARALDPADVDGAVERAQSHFSYLPRPSRATIMRNARRDRDAVFNVLEDDVRLQLLDKTWPHGMDLAPLRAHLTRKARRGAA